MHNNTFVILGNQLFHPEKLKSRDCNHVVMIEDYGLCTFEKHHKLKLYLYLCAMREFRDELEQAGVGVTYFKLEDRTDNSSYTEFLTDYLQARSITHVNFFEIEDSWFEAKIIEGFEAKGISISFHKTPMFMFSRSDFKENFGDNKVFRLANFYKLARKKFDVLLENGAQPIGGKWSFDAENRKRIPDTINVPTFQKPKLSRHNDAVITLIKQRFADHPGALSNIWFPVRRLEAMERFDFFLSQSLSNFGAYEDAIRAGENFLFHSCISPMLNIGLLTPDDVVEKVSQVFKEGLAPINSAEGFIRQILGWREFIRGIYQVKGSEQAQGNFWGHSRQLRASWYSGSTGIVPLDDSIKLALKDGYNHHIPRLMVISNIMNLCEIKPAAIYRWFMEMYIDSSDWVMVPNVFGMATFSDGGLMSTKPYTCGSNYILKMSNYKRGDWCDVLDGLYWRFVNKNRDFYRSNQRLSFQTRLLDKMDADRKKKIFDLAEDFLSAHTV